jgi:hypothetical protein
MMVVALRNGCHPLPWMPRIVASGWRMAAATMRVTFTDFRSISAQGMLRNRGTMVGPLTRAGASIRICAVLVGLAGAACAAAPRQRPVKGGDVDTGPGTVAAARKYLEGVWTLLSYEIFPPRQPSIRLNGQGTLSYDSYGNLKMEIRVDDAMAQSLERAGIPTAHGAISITGRTALDMQARTLTYLVDAQPSGMAGSGPLGLNRPRHWQVDGNVLTLTTNGDDGGTVSVGRWQKMP